MVDILLQAIVGAAVLALAGLKSLLFVPSELTDFELARRVKQGDPEAVTQQRLRMEWPLHQTLIHLVSLLLTVGVITVLVSRYPFAGALLLAVAWLILAEALSANRWVATQAEQLVVRYRPQLFLVVERLAPALRPLAEKRLFTSGAQATFYSKEELLKAVESSKQALSREEKLLIKQAVSYSETRIRDVMTPRSVVVTVEADDTVGPVLLDRLHKSGQSRFPVVRKKLDDVVGMLYMRNLVPLKASVKKVEQAMDAKVYYVHEDKTLDHALHAFLRTKHHLFIVVNEFEEATGVISIEDILETIIGRDIVDEFDQYEDLRAVARLAAAKRQKSGVGEHV